MTRIHKAVRLAGQLLPALRQGRFAYVLHEIASRSPRWLFRFNKGFALVTDEVQPPANSAAGCIVKIATPEDAADVERVNEMPGEHYRRLLESGAVCFLAYYRDNDRLIPGAVLFRASGRCYVEGMSWEHDFGPDGSYCFGVFTAPHARNRGLQSALVARQLQYESQIGTRRFYRLLEFSNGLAYSIAYNLGYRPIMIIYHFKILALRLALMRSLETGRATLKVITGHSAQNALHI